MTDRILVPVDFSASARVALARAEEVALATGAELLVLHVGEEVDQATLRASGLLSSQVRVDHKLGVAPALAALASQLRARGVRARAMHVDGSPRTKILDAIVFEHVTLVVMGTHGRQGIARLLLGSVSARVVQNSPVPVLVCRAPSASGAEPGGANGGLTRIKRLRNILVAVDFVAGSDAAVSAAFELGDKLGAKVHLLHAYPPVVTAISNGMGTIGYDALHNHARSRLHALAQTYQASPSMGRCLAVMGEPALTIVEGAQELRADLIVLGSHGRSELQRTLLGGVATTVLRDAPCEVLIAKSTLGLPRAAHGSPHEVSRSQTTADEREAASAATNRAHDEE